MNDLNVVGLGYIGLPTALMFASHDVNVVGSDIDVTRVENLQKGEIPFDEEGLQELYDYAQTRKMIRFTSECQSARNYIVAVPTPYDNLTKKVDASYVVASVKSIMQVCPDETTIIIESTIAPGTIDKFIRPIASLSGKTIHLAHAPERIIPGKMIYELNHNSRIIGADDKETRQNVGLLYSSFCKGEIVLTDIRTAEMTKVVENTYRDINIAFANELAKICLKEGMDVYEIIRIANKHPRVSILAPGPGVGGHCIAVDPWFLVGQYPDAQLIRQARLVNDSMPALVLSRLEDIMKANKLEAMSQVGLYGLTYKENVNDTRLSPTIQLLSLCEEKCKSGLKVYDPYVTTDLVDNQYHNLDDFLRDVALVVIMVAHDEISNNIYKLSNKIIFDTRNICTIPGTYKL